MMKTTDQYLVQIITAAGHDPSDITDAVWAAGYRKTDFTTEQVIEMAVNQTADTVLNGFPVETLPKTLDDLSQYHLNGIIFEAKWKGTPATVASTVLVNGYSKEYKK
ncbi:hypothetical protein ACNYC7_15595 [Morganella morganii]|uniref:Uncharacterized protein n=1 Tax=Morganella morganii TaxID=582 RepID=A0AAE4FCJ4_MORMO|nr:hypothetical protein [Morganella morganii]EJD6038246.1 hypothetical protein [Morganella morganii]MDS0898459.1 hypothetical protein [Morganella morganii]